MATLLVLDSRTQAQLSRGLWVSEYAVLLCPLRTRIVQSFVNYEKNRNWDSPYGTCVMEPSPCQNPLPVQVEEMEVWSGLVFSLMNVFPGSEQALQTVAFCLGGS